MKYKSLKNVIVILIVVLCYLHETKGSGYMITTPRRWTANEESQVCVTFRDSPPGSTVGNEPVVHNLTINIQTTGIEPEDILPPTELLFIQDLEVHCEKVLLPDTTKTSAQISLLGKIGEATVNYTKPISISTNVEQTFVQTDKYLYKPLQTVKFRLLTVTGPKLDISTAEYDEIYVENPSGTRIAQWLNVPNTNGLIHMEFTLSEEPEEGSYKITAKTLQSKLSTSKTFKVEEYVLPTYKVTVEPPKYVLGSTKLFEFEVCAKYTFGQPVKGKVTLTVHNGGWGSYKTIVTKQDQISGCTTLNVTADELKTNGNKYFAYQIAANALVVEQGTDVELKAKEAKVDISRTALEFEDISSQKFYKPESVYIGEVKVTFPDDSPAPNEPMNVCLSKSCKNMTTNSNGILKFAVPPHLQDESIQIKALNYGRIRANDSSWRSIMYDSSLYKNLKKYHSNSNSSLVIELPDGKLDCIPGENLKITFPVSFAAVGIESARVSVQIISRGQIMFATNEVTNFTSGTSTFANPNILIEPIKEPVTKNLIRGFFTISVEFPRFASPEAKLIVFYSRPDGEVVSDVRTVDITECLLNSVNLTWSAEKAQPGDPVTMSIAAEPLSLCSLGVVDKSVQLLSSKQSDLTVTKLLELAQRSSVNAYDNRQVNDYEYCRNKKTSEDELLPPPIAIARKKRSFAPDWRFPFYSDDIDALHMFDDAGIYIFTDLQLESRPCKRRYHVVMPMYSEVDNRIYESSELGAVRSQSTTKTREYFPETWLWNLFLVWDTGITEEPVILPDSITEWVGSVVCVHPTKGVGISKPKGIVSFRDFFADIVLPPSVKRGETLPVKVSVFNYLKEELPISVMLEESPEFDILAEQGTELGSGFRSSCLSAEDKVVHTIRIKPKVFGDVNITVTASVDTNTLGTCGSGSGKVRSDTLIRPIKVEIEGFEKDKAWTEYVCNRPEDTATGTENPATVTWDIIAPENIIPDSARGFISVVGNLMGPTLENLGKLVKMPYGCGEQNMLNFAPNIFVMPYLQQNSTQELAEKAIKYMEKGYQRELNYRHKDGSFSAFGSRDESGSTWLTAFVLKSFAQARAYIAIDNNDLSMSRDWLKLKQMENGCFESVGKVLHKGMKGGLSKTKSPALLSSFVMISLLESGEDTAGKVIREGLFCLNADQTTNDSYALAVKAYALALAASPDTEATMAALLANSEHSISNRHWKLPELGSSVEVETGGYAILAMLTANPDKYFGDATSVIQWMNQKRNGQGGFVSTQDTIVALQAIAKFDEFTNKGVQDVSVFVEIEPASRPDLLEEAAFNINDQNELLQQKVYFPSVPIQARITVAGTGCALIQAVLRYNEPKPEASLAFDLNVTTENTEAKGCTTKRITACARYLLPDLESNMGIIEVNLVSGYIPLKADLKTVVGNGTGIFKRYEIDGNLVTFYVDQFSSEAVCASFKVKQETEVEEPKPGNVKIYDYYEPEYYVTETYTLPTGCAIKEKKNEMEIPFLLDSIMGNAEEVSIR